MYGWGTRIRLKHGLGQGMTKAELARQFKIGRRTIHRWIETGQLYRDLAAGRTQYAPRSRRAGRARSARRSALPASGHVVGTDSAVTARGAGGAEFATRLRGGGTMMTPTNNRGDRVRAMLADLKMSGALEVIDGILAQADSGATTAGGGHRALLGVQIALRSNRLLETAMRSSRLPVVKTLAQFDFSLQSSIKRDQIENLHELAFVSRRSPGVLRGTLTGLIESLMEAKQVGNLARRLKVLTHPALLVVAEIGDRLPAGEPGRRHSLLQLVNARHERASTVTDVQQELRGLGQGARQRGNGGRADRPPAAPLPHRQHPGQQLPDARPSGSAAGYRREARRRWLNMTAAPASVLKVCNFQLSKASSFRLTLTPLSMRKRLARPRRGNNSRPPASSGVVKAPADPYLRPGHYRSALNARTAMSRSFTAASSRGSEGWPTRCGAPEPFPCRTPAFA